MLSNMNYHLKAYKPMNHWMHKITLDINHKNIIVTSEFCAENAFTFPILGNT